MPTPILLATENPAKLQRLRWLVDGLPLTPQSPAEASVDAAPEESGPTHEANAALKAAAWSAAFNGLAIASDGGLAIPTLGSQWDSVRTARFAGPNAGDLRRVEALLELMRGRVGPERRAYWVEAVALADRGRVLQTWRRQSRAGAIAEAYRPEQIVPGFWVFTLWRFPHLGKRYVDLTPDELEQVEDHWTGLQKDIGNFFAGHAG